MKGSTARVNAAVCLLALAAAACSGASATTTTAPPATVTPATQAPTTVPPTTVPPETTTTAPPTTLSTEPVGDPAALRALAEQVAFDAGIPFEEFFVPDITQPDPIAALEELLKFSEWAFANKPDTALAAIHTIDGSPAFHSERANLDTYESNGWVSQHDPYSPVNFTEVDIEAMPMSEVERADLPDGAKAFQFQSSSDGTELVDVNTGEVQTTLAPWTNRIFLVVIAPTNVGWQEFWYLVLGGSES